ncbi:afadin- and alpha-actinin-binding protein-like isoform X1 [Gouania willdenowi]|uniref:afadin- and alpha-actinin-binding protein-like isoform X1 n=2 Tax=Gouania willdenowi TaxID=441366 RepID=UPI001055CCF7|nr:afadin- and alpha-actinin-binding protein-like isoform X1 [Gouania willdenowi]
MDSPTLTEEEMIEIKKDQEDMFPESRTFCCEENVPQCVSYITQELASLDLSPWLGALSGVSGSGVSLDVVSALNVMMELLQVQRRTMKRVKELQEEHLKTSNTLEHLQIHNSRLKDQLELSLREKAGLHETERQLHLKIRTLQNCLKTEKEEVLKLKNVVFSHESKRKERELVKLKERLSSMLMDRKERPASIEVLNCLSRSDGKRSRWRTPETSNSHEAEMYRKILGQYEERQRSLMETNTDLRNVLQQMKGEMMLLLTPTAGEEPRAGEEPSREGEDGSCDPALDGSCDQAREQLTHSIRLQWRKIRDHVEKMDCEACVQSEQMIPRRAHEEQMENMRREIYQCRDLIHTQQLLLQQGCVCDGPMAALLGDAYSLEEKERLREEWTMFEQQKKNFEGERRSFAEAAIRLGREEAMWEAERSSWMKSHFLSLNPFTDVRRRSSEGQSLPSVRTYTDPQSRGSSVCRTPSSLSTSCPSLSAALSDRYPLDTRDPYPILRLMPDGQR